MSLGFDVIENVLNLPGFADHKCLANGSHVGFAIHAFLAIDTILLLNLVVGIAKELKIELFFVLELFQFCRLIRGNS